MEAAAKDAKRPLDRAGKADIAKAPKAFWGRHKRKHFRHELASAIGVLTLLRGGQAPADWSQLEARLQNLRCILSPRIMAKFGCRSGPCQTNPSPSSRERYSPAESGAGIFADDRSWRWHDYPRREGAGPVANDAWPGQGWLRQSGRTDVAAGENPDLGPLKITYLETLLRAADMRASKQADEKAQVTNA